MTERDETPAALAEVVGRNARRLRGDATADQLAKEARRHGLNWGTGRISDLEHGRVSPTLSMLVALAEALHSVRGAPITLADLVEHDGLVQLSAAETVKGAALQRFLRGEPVELLIGDMSNSEELAAELRTALATMAEERSNLPDALGSVPLESVMEVQRHAGETEARIAKALGVPASTVAAASAHLWGRTLSAERDRRAGPDANAQDRGRITRQLRAEIQAVLDGDG
ncbi:helix-turn-helix domain-containing protein [Mycobacterium simiae]|uniref:helix-turn-helix domain-containing protein n=1 Tax=Mycobacterium simiae TaxID=1784 RepID=UPI002633F1F4|nr:helix-turn-helix transcriptional regulator [Mycobacterium simiae]